MCVLAMNAGICVCVLLAALYSSGCLALPTHLLDEGKLDGVIAEHMRHTRAVPPNGQSGLLFKAQEEEVEEDPTHKLNELLARLISRKGRMPYLVLCLYIHKHHCDEQRKSPTVIQN